MADEEESVKVAVRVRPFNSRETGMKAKMIVKMDGPTTILTDPESGKEHKFTFDFSYFSFDSAAPNFASQTTVWEDLGVGVLKNAYDGYNVSLFAYGQTGAGKSYSMVGYGEAKGIIPIASEKIFDRITENTDDSLTFKVECSMLEIYMEKVRDLFNPSAGELRIRLDPKKGFFVQGLTKNTVADYETIDKLMEAGTKARTVAATNMNATSSRAHTIFQITLTQTKVDAAAGKATDKTSLMNLIDLAGSERANSTGATGARLKEGSAINMSLTSLGNCIAALAYNCDPSHKKKKKVPFRDSALTMLLQNSLGGNAKTIMIAAISPADVNHDETLSTLRYADRAKQIKTKAVVNEDPNERLIRNLRQEIEELRKMLGGQGIVPGEGGAAGGADVDEIRRQMEAERDAEIARMRAELEAKMKAEVATAQQQDLDDAREQQLARERELSAMGVLTGAALAEARERATRDPHIVNLHEDPMLNGQVYYFFSAPGVTRIGRRDAGESQDIKLGGLSIQAEHAIVTGGDDGKLVLRPAVAEAKTHHNGDSLVGEVELHHHDRIIFGNNHVFRVVIPGEMGEGWAPPEGVPEELSFDFAVKEMNKAQVAAIAAEEERRRLEAEEERRKAEERVRELEAKMAEEREQMRREAEEAARRLAEEQAASVDAEELEALKRKQEEMAAEAERKQRELEAKLQAQIEETERMAAKKQKEMRERSLLDEKLLKTIPLVNEANAIADEVGKNLMLEVRLMANQHKHLARMDPDEEGDKVPEPLDTEVYVRVAPKDGEGLEDLWHYNDFMDRLFVMREMYQTFVDNGRTLDGTHYLEQDADPFFIIPTDQLLGRSTLYLDTLLHLLMLNESTPIIDYKGSEQGELQVRIVPHFGDKVPSDDAEAEDDLVLAVNEDGDPVEMLKDVVGRRINITVCVDGARGLPINRSVGAHVRFKFFLEEDQTQTPAIDGKSMNPRFDFQKTIPTVVTDEFLKYVADEPLVMELWARQDDGTAKVAVGPARRFAGGGGAAAAGAGGGSGGGAVDTAALEDAQRAREEAESAAKAAADALETERDKVAQLEKRLDDAQRLVSAASSPRGGEEASAELMRQLQEAQRSLDEQVSLRKEAEAAKAAADEALAKGAGDSELRRQLGEVEARAKRDREDLERRLEAAEERARRSEQAARDASSGGSRACTVM